MNTPAKINLWLEVVGKRPDGYHELSSLMLPIGIYDYLELEFSHRDDIRLTCNHPDVPEDVRNLAWRAAELYCEAAGIRPGFSIELRKNIPIGAGLGGGSSDAAAVLIALDRLHPRALSGERLHALAQRLGADVPFFLYRRASLATGIGEKLKSVQGLPAYPLVLIKPPVMVSTRWVYDSLKLTRGGSRIKVAKLLACPWNLRDVMQNDLETVTFSEYPLLVEIKQWLLEQGALGALMSGSGSTVFAVFSDSDQAEQVGEKAKGVWSECWVAVTQALTGF
ncbi:MAG: 4-(cytidine 5'-diphospho)-2-C-methyl-D-erythritol kinase [Syntrophobacteraceae bacterium]